MRIYNTINSSQLIKSNPIFLEEHKKQIRYYSYLKRFIKNWRLNKLKSVKAQMLVYDTLFNTSIVKTEAVTELDKKYLYLLPFDLVFILSYDLSSDRSKSALNDLIKSCKLEHLLYTQLISYCSGKIKSWQTIKNYKAYELFPEYLDLFHKNYAFICHKKYKVLITATMSAGKSTLINALCGKKVSLSQNMACTSQLHYIIGKPFEDGYTCEYDNNLVIDAGSDELLNDNSKNKSGKISVSTYFNGDLSGKSIVLCDTPGVNSYNNDEHKAITEQKIKSKNYDVILYLLNASQLGTNDDEQHLLFVKNNIGTKPIIFILNKIDLFNDEDDDVIGIISKHRDYLKRIGFNEPIICPLSAKYAFLAKKRNSGMLSDHESREFDRVMLNLEQINYSEYCNEHFGDIDSSNSVDDNSEFLKKCGIKYIEKLLCSYIAEKENENG